jgi:hypothetical protein
MAIRIVVVSCLIVFLIFFVLVLIITGRLGRRVVAGHWRRRVWHN